MTNNIGDGDDDVPNLLQQVKCALKLNKKCEYRRPS